MLRWLLLPLLLATTLHAQVYEGKTLVSASLVADTKVVVPGKPFQVGLVLDMAPKWHTYWEYAGDAGIPTKIEWSLPEGFAAGPFQWPLPERLKEPGDIEVYAYGGKVLLLSTIVPPADLKDQSVTLRGTASWLVCEEICIPGKAELELTLAVGASTSPDNAEIFKATQAQLPSADQPPYSLSWARDGKMLVLSISGLPDGADVDLFPLPAEEETVGHAQNGAVIDGKAEVKIEAVGDLRGVLVVQTLEGRRGWFVASEGATGLSQTGGMEPASPGAGSDAQAAAAVASLGLWGALLSGFVGGLILNLMPCVLPVISLKIFGFVRQAGDHPAKIFRHGLAFVAGIFVWFLGLGLLIVAFKAAGGQATWAFQFQNPWFNVVLACIVLVFALNLFGVFEIILPGRATNALASAESTSGYAGSFFQGIFATLLATPCTAPFLGTALGYAFAQSSFVIMAMFASIAAGMAAPYFLLSAKPEWMKLLPKPGVWMERVKQFMGFPLLATLLWLLTVVGGQKGLDGVIWLSAYLICLALACWIYGSFCGPLSSLRGRLVSLFLVALLVIGGGSLFLGQSFASAQPPGQMTKSSEGGIQWVPFSQQALDGLIAEGKPVFVDFTADWCISCKFNEKTAINVPAVIAAVNKNNVIMMKADWTNANPEITAALKKFGRVGVPFYVLYPAGRADQPIVLPELLTQQIVLDALAKAR